MEDTRAIGAAEAEARQQRLARVLADHGVAAGDRIAIVAGLNGPSLDHLCLIAAALRTGVVPVVLNPALLPHERDALLADAEPAVTVTDDELHRWSRLADDASPTELAPAPLARPMHYTSGTTGVPKGVWTGILDDDAGAALIAEEREQWGFAAGDVHLVCGPLHHSAPVRFAMGTWLAGGTVVLAGKFDAVRAARAIAEHRPTTAFCAPAHLQRLLALGDRPSFSSFRLVAHAGAPCPPALKRRVLDAFPAGSVWEFYGATEGQVTACSPEQWLARPGTVGRARPGRRVTVDRDGAIWCEVPAYARFEYWRDPVATARAWRGNAFSVFDLGRLDADGYLFIDGRRDDLIISGGVNVYPAEVERALESVPGVEAAAVFGRDDEAWGTRVCAAVVGPVTAADVLAAARTRLAPYKVPKEIHIVAELPVQPTGKLRRSTLAADLNLL